MKKLIWAVTALTISTAQAATIHVDVANCPGPGDGSVGEPYCSIQTAIDTEHPGQLCVARGAYNTRVAGVVSGANGLVSGAILGSELGRDDGVVIALSGRVWVSCDAALNAIQPGDLLTT